MLDVVLDQIRQYFILENKDIDNTKGIVMDFAQELKFIFDSNGVSERLPLKLIDIPGLTKQQIIEVSGKITKKPNEREILHESRMGKFIIELDNKNYRPHAK
jgi:hypothetical protein